MVKKYILLLILSCFLLFTCSCADGKADVSLPKEYEVIINNIINAYPWNDNDFEMVPENPELSYMYRRNEKLSDIGFAIKDLDGNGQPELIITDPNIPFIYDMYTLVDGKAVHLFASGERYAYCVYENGYIEKKWSGSSCMSGHDFYYLNDGSLEFIKRITLDANYALDAGIIKSAAEANGENTFFISNSENFEDYRSVSFSEAQKMIEILQKANKPTSFEYTFLSDHKNKTE